ncbi:hypothetical protein [Lentzea sp. NEAU-D7]|uniref:hypothetical protein n=1 Tax=Lentzea sp. NEAU-D7 TaxID=2994667 RepID=UPI00224B6FB5|nr:hypothetical protein [Lentzea sp. NEAU-D7]MCX2952140.1 hypothetical protein [Lentzea sp. NEAU-D7]
MDPLDPGDLGLVARSGRALGFEREAKARFPEYHPLPLWPEPGGYLPFGTRSTVTRSAASVADRHAHRHGVGVAERAAGSGGGLYRFDEDELAEAATFRAVAQTITD